MVISKGSLFLKYLICIDAIAADYLVIVGTIRVQHHDFMDWEIERSRCPPFFRKRTFTGVSGMSALCQKQTSTLFDTLVGAQIVSAARRCEVPWPCLD